MTTDYKNFRPEMAAALGGTLADNMVTTLNTMEDLPNLTDYSADLLVNTVQGNVFLQGGYITNTSNTADATISWAAANEILFAGFGAPCTITGLTGANALIIAKSGTRLGFYGIGPVVRPTAYTQTYTTATKTHSNPTATTLTVAAGAGTNDGTIGAITGDATVTQAVQELAAAINALIADVANIKGVVNQVIDDLQGLGLLQ